MGDRAGSSTGGSGGVVLSCGGLGSLVVLSWPETVRESTVWDDDGDWMNRALIATAKMIRVLIPRAYRIRMERWPKRYWIPPYVATPVSIGKVRSYKTSSQVPLAGIACSTQ